MAREVFRGHEPGWVDLLLAFVIQKKPLFGERGRLGLGGVGWWVVIDGLFE